MPSPANPCSKVSSPTGALRIKASASPVIVIWLGIRPVLTSHQAAVQTNTTTATAAAAWVMRIRSGETLGRCPEVAIRLAENCLNRHPHALDQEDYTDHDQAEQQSVFSESLPGLVVPELPGECHH